MLHRDFSSAKDAVNVSPYSDAAVGGKSLSGISEYGEPLVGRTDGEQLELNGRDVLSFINDDVPIGTLDRLVQHVVEKHQRAEIGVVEPSARYVAGRGGQCFGVSGG